MKRSMAMAGVIMVALQLISTVTAASTKASPAPAVDCSVPFNDLMPCIEFVNSNSSAAPPPRACCTAFAATQTQRPECLCQLHQAFADPATAPGNATRAAEIPVQCKVKVDYSGCASLLGLAPAPAPVPVHVPVHAPGPAPRTGKDYDCTDSINELTSCLGFVSGDGKGAPPSDCCAAISSVQAREPVCICQLVAQAADGAEYGINATLAQSLPQLCHVAANTSQCATLLNSPLSPSSSPTRAPIYTPTPTPTLPPMPLSSIVPVPAFAPVPAPPEECSNEYALLQSCFAYVMANDSAPPSSECCSSFGSVVANRPVCLCQLLQTVGSGDPATAGINATRAMDLPGVCKVVIDVATCPALLGQPVAAPSPLMTPSVHAPSPSRGNHSMKYPSLITITVILWSFALQLLC